jgi:hypothetical protein
VSNTFPTKFRPNMKRRGLAELDQSATPLTLDELLLAVAIERCKDKK